jgi:hypothetical protein
LSLIATLEKVVKDDAGLRKRLAAFLRTKSIDAADSDTWHVLLSKLAFLSSPDPTDAVVRVFSAVALYESVLLRLTESNVDAGGVVELLSPNLLSFRDVIEILIPSTDQFDFTSFTDLALAWTLSETELTAITITRFTDFLQVFSPSLASITNTSFLDDVLPTIVSRVVDALESVHADQLHLMDSVEIPRVPRAAVHILMLADIIQAGVAAKPEPGTPILFPLVYRFLDVVGTTCGGHLINSVAVLQDSVAVRLVSALSDHINGFFIDNTNLQDSAVVEKYLLNGGIHSAGLGDSVIAFLEERVEEDE